jgi:hypothetical protein
MDQLENRNDNKMIREPDAELQRVDYLRAPS